MCLCVVVYMLCVDVELCIPLAAEKQETVWKILLPSYCSLNLLRQTRHLSLWLFNGIRLVFTNLCFHFLCMWSFRFTSRRRPGSRPRRPWPMLNRPIKQKQLISGQLTNSTRMKCIASNGTARETFADWWEHMFCSWWHKLQAIHKSYPKFIRPLANSEWVKILLKHTIYGVCALKGFPVVFLPIVLQK